MSDNDFEIHGVREINNERQERARVFTTPFSSSLFSQLKDSGGGFRIYDKGKTQPDGQSCLIASITAAARGLETTNLAFDTTVNSLMKQAREMGIVDRYGILGSLNKNEVATLAEQIGLEIEVVSYFPNRTDKSAAKSLGDRFGSELAQGNAIAMLIPAKRHYVMIHTEGGEIKMFDPLSGTDRVQNPELIAQYAGNIVNGEMQGVPYAENHFIVLRPSQADDDDFKIHGIS